MKPTQEQILSALNKLVRENKTELKAEKIELGLMDDLIKRKKFLSEGLAMQDEFLKQYNDAKNMLNALKSNTKDLDITLKFVEKIKKAAKDLGVDIPKEVADIESKAEKIQKDTSRFLKFKF